MCEKNKIYNFTYVDWYTRIFDWRWDLFMIFLSTYSLGDKNGHVIYLRNKNKVTKNKIHIIIVTKNKIRTLNIDTHFEDF